MSRVTLSPGIDIWRGKVSGKSGMTMRIKSYRDDEGNIVKMGPQEYYRRGARKKNRRGWCGRRFAERQVRL